MYIQCNRASESSSPVQVIAFPLKMRKLKIVMDEKDMMHFVSRQTEPLLFAIRPAVENIDSTVSGTDRLGRQGHIAK